MAKIFESSTDQQTDQMRVALDEKENSYSTSAKLPRQPPKDSYMSVKHVRAK